MSYIEAQRDGIPTKVDKRGNTAYYPPCHICGNPVYSWAYRPGTRYTCRDCKEKTAHKSTKKHLCAAKTSANITISN